MPEYVYGVVAADSRPPASLGLDGYPLRLVDGEDGVSALVSRIENSELRLGREEVLAHSRALSEALDEGAILPMRFGIVMATEADVRERLLDPHTEELRSQLEQFRGKFEANVRIVYEDAALMQEVVSQHPEVASLRESIQGRDPDATYYERIQLGQLVAEAVERIRQEDAENLLAALQQVSLDQNVSPPAHERVALNAAFLLDEERSREFDEVLEAIAEGQSGRLRFRYTGPLPPHSFVELAGTG